MARSSLDQTFCYYAPLPDATALHRPRRGARAALLFVVAGLPRFLRSDPVGQTGLFFFAFVVAGLPRFLRSDPVGQTGLFFFAFVEAGLSRFLPSDPVGQTGVFFLRFCRGRTLVRLT